jgi:hypothetical protein
MKEEMQQQNKSKLAILLIAPVVAAVALLVLRPSDEKKIEKPVEQVVPQPVVEVKQPEPEAEPTADVEATRDVLLGLNKPVEPPPVEAKKIVQQRPKRREIVEDEPEETNEELFGSGDGLSDAKFRSTIESWAGMRGCVRTSKQRAAESTGALKMSLTIATTGAVVDSRVFEESNDTARVVAKCVQRQVRSLKFPAFAASETRVTKEAKFVF